MPSSPLFFLVLVLTALAWRNGVSGYGVDREDCDFPTDPAKDTSPFDRYGREVASFCADACGGRDQIGSCKVYILPADYKKDAVQCFCKGSIPYEKAAAKGVQCFKHAESSKPTCFQCRFDSAWAARNLKKDEELSMDKRPRVCINNERDNKSAYWQGGGMNECPYGSGGDSRVRYFDWC